MKIVALVDPTTQNLIVKREFSDPKKAERLFEILTTYYDTKKVEIYLYDPDEEEDW